MSGRVSTTFARASASPAKSGTRSSTAGGGDNARRSPTTRANCPAPPSARSSLVTEVTTTCRQRSSDAAAATRAGSAGSGGDGIPEATLQNAHPREQTSPRMRTVAVPSPQHSPTFGQRASRQTVTRPCLRTVSATRETVSPDGARTVSHGGRSEGAAPLTRTPGCAGRTSRPPVRGSLPSGTPSPSSRPSRSLRTLSTRTGGSGGSRKDPYSR